MGSYRFRIAAILLLSLVFGVGGERSVGGPCDSAGTALAKASTSPAPARQEALILSRTGLTLKSRARAWHVGIVAAVAAVAIGGCIGVAISGWRKKGKLN